MQVEPQLVWNKQDFKMLGILKKKVQVFFSTLETFDLCIVYITYIIMPKYGLNH